MAKEAGLRKHSAFRLKLYFAPAPFFPAHPYILSIPPEHKTLSIDAAGNQVPRHRFRARVRAASRTEGVVLASESSRG